MAKAPALVHRTTDLPYRGLCGAGSDEPSAIPLSPVLTMVTCHRCRLMVFARDHIGDRVEYLNPDSGKRDAGRITSVNTDWVFVLYDYQPLDAANGQATDPRNLELLS